MYKVLCLLQCSSRFSVVVDRNRDFVNFLKYFYQGLFGRGFESRLRRCDVIFWFSNFGVYQVVCAWWRLYLVVREKIEKNSEK